MTKETTLTPLQRVMERALLIENTMQMMEQWGPMPGDTEEDERQMWEEYHNLNEELNALYDRSVELGYVSGEGVILPNN